LNARHRVQMQNLTAMLLNVPSLLGCDVLSLSEQLPTFRWARQLCLNLQSKAVQEQIILERLTLKTAASRNLGNYSPMSQRRMPQGFNLDTLCPILTIKPTKCTNFSNLFLE